jgi:integrin beta 8
MDVVFKDLKGFGYIYAPQHFDAGYCKGRCKYLHNLANQHALFQSLVRKKHKDRAPKLCCAPNKLSDLEILHVDENDTTKLKVTTWSDTTVEECACS